MTLVQQRSTLAQRMVGVVLATMLLVAVGAPHSAEALGTFNWYSKTSPLKVAKDGKEAWGYGTWSLLNESTGLRSRMQGERRTLNGDDKNMAKATLVTEFRNCSTCSWQTHKQVTTSSYWGNSWQSFNVSTDLPTGGSHARGRIRVTLDRRSFKPDAHSSWIYKGPTSY